jgi:hypothetical protein
VGSGRAPPARETCDWQLDVGLRLRREVGLVTGKEAVQKAQEGNPEEAGEEGGFQGNRNSLQV